jgi:hypothetical protein
VAGMATAKLRRVVRVGFLLRAALLVTMALTTTAFAAGPAIAQDAPSSAALSSNVNSNRAISGTSTGTTVGSIEGSAIPLGANQLTVGVGVRFSGRATARRLHGAILAGKAVSLAGFVATLPWPAAAARAILSWVEDLGRIA